MKYNCEKVFRSLGVVIDIPSGATDFYHQLVLRNGRGSDTTRLQLVR